MVDEKEQAMQRVNKEGVWNIAGIEGAEIGGEGSPCCWILVRKLDTGWLEK